MRKAVTGSGTLAHMMDVSSERAQAIREYFANQYDRANRRKPNPLFAGRDEELNRVLRYAVALDRAEHPEENMTALFYGAPGSGKSEMLTQLRAALRDADWTEPPVILTGRTDMLTEAAAMAKAIHRQAPPEIADRLNAMMKDTQWSLGIPSVIGAQWKNLTPRSEIGKLVDVAECLTGWGRRRTPTIILMVDEAQEELREALTKPECFVRHLHKAETGLKVLTVYGGLGNTPTILAKCGVTRPGQHMRFPLKRLGHDDARNIATEALAATTDKPGGVIAMWAGEIVEFAQGWPAHLNTALRAVATHAQPNGWCLDPDGFNSAMTTAHENRRTYYEDRLDRCERLDPRQYSRWAALMRRTHPVRAHNVGAALGLSDDEANALTAEAVGAGLLEPLGGRKYATPIPSLLRHIEAEGVLIDREDDLE